MARLWRSRRCRALTRVNRHGQSAGFTRHLLPRGPLGRGWACAQTGIVHDQRFQRPRAALAEDLPVGTRAPATPAAAPGWVRGPAWDLAWTLNALWLAPLLLVLARGHDDLRYSGVDSLFFLLAVPLWFGHRFSSAWLAYATPGFRPLLRTQRTRFVVVPAIIAVACFAVLLAPLRWWPMPVAERVVWLTVVDYLFVSWHFAAQHFGLLSLYRSRAGRAADATTRRLDRWFALIVGGGVVVVADGLSGSIAVQERWITPLLGSFGTELVQRALHDGGIAVVLVLTVRVLWNEFRSASPSWPRVGYVVGVAAMVLIGLLARDPFLFIVIWSVQHWTAAMGLASLAASGGGHVPQTRFHRLLAPINRRPWAVLLVLAVISVLSLPILEVEAVGDEWVYADRIYGQLAWWLRTAPFLPVLLALGFATGFIHYVLDRAVFRFASPEVREAGRGLLRPRG